MNITIEAIYEAGVLRPLQPLPSLKEREKVRLTQHRLLTNDALTTAVMEKPAISHLATNDDNFDAVSGLTVWKPR